MSPLEIEWQKRSERFALAETILALPPPLLTSVRPLAAQRHISEILFNLYLTQFQINFGIRNGEEEAAPKLCPEAKGKAAWIAI